VDGKLEAADRQFAEQRLWSCDLFQGNGCLASQDIEMKVRFDLSVYFAPPGLKALSTFPALILPTLIRIQCFRPSLQPSDPP